MKTRVVPVLRSLCFGLSMVGWGLLTETALAFSITSVTLTPASPVPAGSNIVMTVNMTTPSRPVWLYQPTEVAVQGNQIFVDVYPDSGLMTVIGVLSTNVNLGVLPGGTYQYEVRLHPIVPPNVVPTNRGSFSVLPTFPPPPTNAPPVVTITAPDPIATEGTNCYRWPGWPSPLPASCSGTNTATFLVRRSGDINSDLTVFYAVGGSASNGVDYALLPGTVVIPAGQKAARITVWPVDDALPERIETVVLGLHEPPFASPLPSPYLVGKPARAAAIIVDDDQPRPCTGRLRDGCFHLTQPASNSTWFRLECSTDLVHWTSLCTNSVTDGAFHFVDPDADTASQRFYRTVPENNPPAD